jgi:hypothetical protein
MAASQLFLLIACVHWTLTNAAQIPLCAEPRAQLETAVALVSRLARQLEEARHSVIARELQVRACELGVNSPAWKRSSEAVETAVLPTNGQRDSSDAGESPPVRMARQSGMDWTQPNIMN